jgi:hypothetical protein
MSRQWKTYCGLAVLLAAGGCTGGWRQLRTKHITAYTDRPVFYGETIQQLEYSYAALATFFPKAEVGTVEVLLMDGAAFLQEFGADRPGLALPGLPGAARIGRRNLVVMSQGVDTSYSMSLLTHVFLYQAVPNAPLWLHQSLSRYLSNALVKAGQGRWQACFGLPPALESRFYQIPLARFFTVTWDQYAEAGPSFMSGTGRALMDYIFHADGGAHLQKIPAIFSAASRGVTGAEIMAATFPGVSLQQLDERISSFHGSQTEQRARGMLCPLPIPIPADRVPDESSPSESPVPPAEIENLIAALKKLPHGEGLPVWYPSPPPPPPPPAPGPN